jgi:hypothetical protein
MFLEISVYPVIQAVLQLVMDHSQQIVFLELILSQVKFSTLLLLTIYDKLPTIGYCNNNGVYRYASLAAEALKENLTFSRPPKIILFC